MKIMKIKQGDQAKVLSGKDRGKTGKVLRTLPKVGKIVIEKVNVAKKHRRARHQGERSERISIPMPIDISNIQLICLACGKPTRVGLKVIDKKKIRVCKRCSAEV